MYKKHPKDTDFRAYITGYSPEPMLEKQLERKLKELFPTIANLRITSRDKYWNGFGFVNFYSKTALIEFIRSKKIRINDFKMNLVIKAAKDGKKLKKFMKDVKWRKVNVKRIPLQWDDNTLEEFFSKIGDVENAYVYRKVNHKQEFLDGMVIFKAKRDAMVCAQMEEIYLSPYNEDFITVKLKHQRGEDLFTHSSCDSFPSKNSSLREKKEIIFVPKDCEKAKENGKKMEIKTIKNESTMKNKLETSEWNNEVTLFHKKSHPNQINSNIPEIRQKFHYLKPNTRQYFTLRDTCFRVHYQQVHHRLRINKPTSVINESNR